MIAELLHWLGFSGSVVVVASVLAVAYHGHEIFQLLSSLGLYAKISGALVVLFLIATSGIVPGLRLVVDPGAAWSFISGVVDVLVTGARESWSSLAGGP